MPNLLYDMTTKNITCIKLNNWQQSKEIFEITQSLNIIVFSVKKNHSWRVVENSRYVENKYNEYHTQRDIGAIHTIYDILKLYTAITIQKK